jgi:hypothetical protein
MKKEDYDFFGLFVSTFGNQIGWVRLTIGQHFWLWVLLILNLCV